MRIGEVAGLTGLSISNIRFYEKKGLIEPDREIQSKYRDYTEMDVFRLKQIVLYRKMDMPIELIAAIMEEKMTVQEAVKQQLQDLMEKQLEIQGAIDLCQKVMKDGNYEERDVDIYLNYVKEEEAKGTKFAEVEELLNDLVDFTQFNQMMGDPNLGWVFRNPIANRVASVVWILLWVVVPIVGIVDDCLDGNGVRPFYILFWSVWLIFFGIHFYRYRKSKTGKNISVANN